jgi:hypothetical protein
VYLFFLHVDRDFAAVAYEKECPSCGGALHAANYLRKPRGGPDDLPDEFRVRFSNCCARDGCRRRALVPSVRFLDRRIYLGVIVCLVTAMRQGPTPTGCEKLTKIFGCDRRTLERWRIWWREVFPTLPFWKAERARFPSGIDRAQLPTSLIVHFDVQTSEGIGRLMLFLAPLA